MTRRTRPRGSSPLQPDVTFFCVRKKSNQKNSRPHISTFPPMVVIFLTLRLATLRVISSALALCLRSFPQGTPQSASLEKPVKCRAVYKEEILPVE